jgi:hypothetical protein
MKNVKFLRNFHYWNGFNEFYCKGHIMIGPNGIKIFSLTFSLINIPIGILYIFTILVLYYNL